MDKTQLRYTVGFSRRSSRTRPPMHLFFEKAELPICNSKAKNNNWALVQLSREGVDLYNGSTFHHIEVVRENECCKKCLKKAIKLQENADRIALEIFKILKYGSYR